MYHAFNILFKYLDQNRSCRVGLRCWVLSGRVAKSRPDHKSEILFRRSRPKAGVAGIETAFAFQNGPTTTTTTNRPPGAQRSFFLLTLEKSMIVKDKKVIIKQRVQEEQRLKRIYKKNIDLMKSLDQQIEGEEDLHEEP